MRRCLPITRVIALVGGLALVAAFFMPWFSSQGLLLSGQFLHTFLTSAGPADLRRFVPGVSPSEAHLLNLLVDLFPVTGAITAAASLVDGLFSGWSRLANVLIALSGGIALVAWGAGISRLPAGSAPEIGLWLLAVGSVSVLTGVLLDLLAQRSAAP